MVASEERAAGGSLGANLAGSNQASPDQAGRLLARGRERGRVRLRTLVLIRWAAIAGQVVTLLIVARALRFDLPLPECLGIVAISVGVNLGAMGRRASVWLGDRDAALMLGYDVVQLAVLLYLTGGLINPFAILILAPVMVSAALLSRFSTLSLGALAVAAASGLAVFHRPLPWLGAFADPSPILVLAIWIALVLAIVFVAGTVWSVAEEARRMSDALAATQMALDREHRASALGALAAAAAHQLGSPLSTIAVVAKEMAREIDGSGPLNDDVTLLQKEIARCREILAQLAARPEADRHRAFDRLPLRALIEAALAPHTADRPEIAIAIRANPAAAPPEPTVPDSAELVQGLGSLLQNAVQFAREAITIGLDWSAEAISLTIRDDGPGFPDALFDRLGEPYVSIRDGKSDGEETGALHMGLGIFIAFTLLDHTGATLAFRNRSEGGAEVVIEWQRPTLDRMTEHMTRS